MSSAARQRRLEERRAEGKRVYAIEADEVGLEEMLLDGRFLKPEDRKEGGEFAHATVEAALAKMVEILILTRQGNGSGDLP